MSVHDIAGLIPAEFRKEMLELNMISRAQAVATDPSMYYLIKIWQTYVETSFRPDCPKCIGRVLDNFKQLQPVLIEMEKKSKMLNDL